MDRGLVRAVPVKDRAGDDARPEEHGGDHEERAGQRAAKGVYVHGSSVASGR